MCSDFTAQIAALHAAKAIAIVATDLLALCLLKEPGAMGADIAVGSSQRFGVPMGYGGPHAAFMSCRTTCKRPCRAGSSASRSTRGAGEAYRLSLQTREQHIRREKATSNVCTAQALLAVMASFYAVFHGPKGLRAIAERVHFLTNRLARALKRRGAKVGAQGLLRHDHGRGRRRSGGHPRRRPARGAELPQDRHRPRGHQPGRDDRRKGADPRPARLRDRRRAAAPRDARLPRGDAAARPTT